MGFQRLKAMRPCTDIVRPRALLPNLFFATRFSWDETDPDLAAVGEVVAGTHGRDRMMVRYRLGPIGACEHY
jgi:hypothetical protein